MRVRPSGFPQEAPAAAQTQAPALPSPLSAPEGWSLPLLPSCPGTTRTDSGHPCGSWPSHVESIETPARPQGASGGGSTITPSPRETSRYQLQNDELGKLIDKHVSALHSVGWPQLL